MQLLQVGGRGSARRFPLPQVRVNPAQREGMSGGVNYTREQARELAKKPRFTRQIVDALSPAVPAPNVEQPTRSEPLATYENPPLDTRVRIEVHSFRHRLCDEAGISEKACVDGLVRGGVLVDDSQAQVESIRHFQTKVPRKEEEYTVIEVYEA